MSSVIPLSRRPYDWLFLAYFLVHIPVTLCIDAQVLLPKAWFPALLQRAMQDWIRDYDDVVLRTAPLWFQSFIWIELICHVPYFFFAVYAFARGRNWIRTTTLVYSTAVITSMCVILPEAWSQSFAPLNTKLALVSIYGIWLLMPILLMARVWNERVFDYATPAPAQSKKKHAQ